MSHPGQNPGQQPISFKTVPGRHRTQKWTQAKTNNYDGDDWGGYDPYDEFGGYDDPSASQQQNQYGQGLQRQPSFDRGVDTERRQFSSGTQPEQHSSPIAGSGGISHHSRSPDSSRSRPREFSNPGQVPQPLNTPRSPPPAGSVERPPRKSSLGSVSPGPDARPVPATTSPNTGKALPFIRPSDIYKRMADEQQKERQSMESGRPSMDSVQRELGSPSAAQPALTQQKSHESVPSASGQASTLDPVNETAEHKPVALGISQPTVGATDTVGHDPLHPEESSPRLPPVSRVSDFGSFMPRNEEEERISATGLAASTAAANAAASALSSSRDVTPTMPAGHISSTHDHPVHSSDPASEIADERSTATAAEDVGRAPGEDPGGLSHQPSSGFRSVVHKAFDSQGNGSTPDSPVSREHNHSVVSRSDTNSTGSISPIMSRVPSAATAQKKQQERDAVVPSIAEETPLEIARSRPFPGSALPAMSPKPSIKRKPTPSHSRNVSSEVTGFTPGYRRSMETPSPNNSPARTPGVGDADTRRFSGPMAAQTVTNPEAPDVSPDAPEMPSATLHPVETPLETPGSVDTSTTGTDVVKPLPTTGRGRSGTDYSIRESDLAQEASSLPSQHPDVAEAVTQQQKLFLDTHPNVGSGPNSPTVLSPTSGVARPFSRPTTAGGSGRDSPAGTSHSRVRNIVDQYHQIDEESRRNSAASGMSSKSSWSNFGGDEDPQPGLTRKATGGSMLSQQTPASPGDTGMFPSYDHADATAEPSTIRPEAERQESFRPHLPGEWVSATATPASEVSDAMAAEGSRGREVTPASPPTPRGQHMASADEEIDLTPTTRKTKLRESDPTLDSEEQEKTNPVTAVKNAGEALGTALMAHAGYGHQTQDFASKGEAAPVDVPEMRPHRETGDIQHLNVPPLRRENSDAPSEVTLGSVGPTPPAKDTPQPPGLDVDSGPSDGRPMSNYFAGYNPDAVAPLSFGKNSPGTAHEPTFARPAVLPTLSTDTGAADFESDRLRKDIVRSLGPESMDNLKQQSMQEDAHRIQNALDAPANERRVASGQSALPPAEIRNAEGRSGLPSQSRPGLLGQRFSWENRSADDDGLYGPMAVVGETEGDENRESFGRPRSNQGLHVVNTQVVADSEPSTAEAEKQVEPDFMLKEPADAEKRLSAALPVGTTALAHESQGHSLPDYLASPAAEVPESKNGGLSEVAPTAMVEDDSDANRSGEPQSPRAPPQDDSPTLPSTSAAPPQQSAAAQAKIPAFRDLAAIKSTPDRIAAYESTRHRFAEMNTGLQGWLSGMLAAHPEYANAGSQKYEGPAAIQTTGLSNTISGIGGTIRNHGHKHSGSILKIGGERKASTTGSTHAAPESGSSGGHVDVEKMQAKGKDFMKSAGAGAKGLFAKGKSRFGRGGEKVE